MARPRASHGIAKRASHLGEFFVSQPRFCVLGWKVNPSQPLTSGVWIGNWGDESKLSPTERCQLEESDVITFHSYDPREAA